MKYELLPHQYEAINNIQKVFTSREIPKAGIISIPTGGGKTYTTIYWLNMLLKQNKIKIIWYAQSFELLNQAYQCMKQNLNNKLVIKRVSSEKNHYNIKDIENNDDIILITFQSAIKNSYNENSYNAFVNSNKNNLICIIDEAHHAPAYGFRNMILDLKEKCNNLWILGLTATPTYTNEKLRGWLWNIFDQGVVYEVEKSLLQQQGILAKEKIKYIITPTKINLQEEDYTWLVKKHREIPEHIIEELAANTERNKLIASEYLQNKEKYGKTIIFLDRWYQCEYLKTELQKYGVTCDAIYSFVNDRKNTNEEIVTNFRHDKFDVLLNVKMLTEGTDIPTVKTVFITHETQSYILFNQMMGRCLRGKRAGGNKDEANVVLFGDQWSKSIGWYIPNEKGELNKERIEKKTHPIYTFPLSTLTELNNVLSKNNNYMVDYSMYIPEGWYQVKYINFTYDDDSIIKVVEDYVTVFKADKNKFDKMITFLLMNPKFLKDEWKKEDFNEEKLETQIYDLCDKFSIDGRKENVRQNVVKIIRHIAQNKSLPQYINSNLNLDNKMKQIIEIIKEETPEKQIIFLKYEFSRPGSLWADLYKTFIDFKMVVDLHLTQYLLGRHNNKIIKEVSNKDTFTYKNCSTKELISIVKQREKYCKCCGIENKQSQLFVEAINPSLGKKSIRNLQTLCAKCKKFGKDIDFNCMITILTEEPTFIGIKPPKKFDLNLSIVKSMLRCSINVMYQCGAVFDIKFISKGKKQFCEITIFKGNPILWLKNQEKLIIHYITNELKQEKITEILYKILE